MVAGNEKSQFLIVLRNLTFILKAMFLASSRIHGLIAKVLNSYEPNEFFIGKSAMILGLLYKTKKKRALALQHLTEAQRIFSQFGQTPMLARVETALAELGQ
jgi:hypothetical protein